MAGLPLDPAACGVVGVNDLDLLRQALDDEAALNDLLTGWSRKIKAIGRGEAHRACLPRHLFPEAVAATWEVVATMIHAERTGQARTRYNWWGHVTMHARHRARTLSADTGVSGMSGVIRRGQAVRAWMAANGGTPAQAVAALNAAPGRDKRAGTFSVAEHATFEQFMDSGRHVEPLTLATAADDAITDMMIGPSYGWVLAPFEGRAFMEEVISHLDEADRPVVAAWLEQVWLGEQGTAAHVARALRMSPAAVSEAIERGRVVGEQILTARLAGSPQH
ncbi:MAG: hypothetical protein E6640_01740 [Actinomyces urogenitalis]|uniref:hypothetical protein n=1 Tax=Actinomyces urogenitalis TaxID=103621 RepID=UPI002911CCE2|nr:hypothetical protein [Actinomyces urogenitalis]MDU6150933.1 hypothetical protein [Actinomyces urogenitalis]